MQMKNVDLYASGSCSFSFGAWSTILNFVDTSGKITEKLMYGYDPKTSSNRMELLSVIKGLKELKYRVDVNVYTRSVYIQNAFTKDWLDLWINNGWRNARGRPVKNQALWKTLVSLISFHNLNWIWVNGEEFDTYNRCREKALEISSNGLMEEDKEYNEYV